jgi:uncharacterized protein
MLALAAVPAIIHWRSLWLIVAAFIAGVLNAIAGGGSFLSFPALLGTGILPIQANATNTVALWPGQLASVAAYRDDIRKNTRLLLAMSLSGLLGGAIGAAILLNTPQTTFMRLVPWLLLVASALFSVSRPILRWLERRALARHQRAGTLPQPPRPFLVFLCTVVVCAYVGYFGAGAGFLIITLLSLFGLEDLHEINALKVVATSMANGVAFLIFAVSGNVEWRYCFMAMVACGAGGYMSARFAKMIPQPVLRAMVIVIGFTMSAWFFWKTH